MMWNGKKKAVTFSYDDSVTQDQRLIQLFDRYGLKCTFNVNYGKLGLARGLIRGDNVTVAHVRPQAHEIPGIYRGHEVAGHTLTHAHLPRLTDEEVIREVQEDIDELSRLVGYQVVGTVYPCGDFDDRVVKLITEHTTARYARTTVDNRSFELQDNLIRFEPTLRHARWEELFALGKQFLEMKDPETPQLFYIWGHSFEFDVDKSWERMEEFCKMIAGQDDIFYGTNSEVFFGIDNYKKGMES